MNFDAIWTTPDPSKSLRELPICDGLLRNKVDRPVQSLIGEHMLDCAPYIIQSDPAPVLGTTPDHAPKTQLKGQEHFPKSTTIRAENHPKAKVDHPHAGAICPPCRRFPLLANRREKTPARQSLLR